MDAAPPFTLRQWRDDDLGAFAEMNADPEVMRFIGAPMDLEQSRAMLLRVRAAIDERGWGLWAVEVGGACAGWTGLSVPRFTAAFTPCVEIGWRLRREFWGRGLATAAAREAERRAFGEIGLPALVSFATAANVRSRRVMERLGLTRDPAEDFLHPNLPEGHPLRPHVLYRKAAPQASARG